MRLSESATPGILELLLKPGEPFFVTRGDDEMRATPLPGERQAPCRPRRSADKDRYQVSALIWNIGGTVQKMDKKANLR